MRQTRKHILLLILGSLVSGLSGILGNIATGMLPESLAPYLWLSWPLFAALTIITIILTIWQVRVESRPDVVEVVQSDDTPPTRDRPSPPHAEPPRWTRADVELIGRTQELNSLQARWDSTQLDSAQAVFVIGPAGIGKTRLIQTFLSQQINNHKFWLLSSRAFEGDQNTPYLALRETLRPIVEKGLIPPAMPDEELAELARLLPAIAEHRPDLPAVQERDPEQAQIHRRLAFVDFIVHLSRTAPVILYIDDLQWTDSATLESTQHLLTRNPTTPLLVICSLRAEEEEIEECSEFRTNLHRGGLLTEILLDPFTEAEAHQMVRAMSRMVEAPMFSRRLYEHSEGNPFFMLETIQMLFDEGLLFLDEKDQWATEFDESPGAYAELPIPESVADVIRLRLKELDSSASAFLNAASVIGRDFDPDFVREVTNLSESAVDQAIEDLLARGLIKEEGRLSDFSHGMLREAIYDELTFRERRRLHRRVVEVLERDVDETSSSLEVQQLAHHFYRGQVWPKALTYQLRAGREALALFETRAAQSYLETAQTIAESELDGDVPNEQKLIYLEGLGDVYRTLGMFGQSLDHYLCGFDLVQNDGVRSATLCRKIAVVFERQTRYDEAVQWLDRGLQAVEHDGDAAILSRLYLQYGLISVRQGNLDLAFEWANKALVSESPQAHNLLGVLYRAQGDLEQASVHLQKSIDLAEANRDLINLLKAYGNLGVVLFEMDRWEEAQDAYERALKMSSDIGDAYMHAMIQCNLSDGYIHLGNLPGAIDHATAGLAEYRALESSFGEAHAHLNWGSALLKMGKPQQARVDHLEVARKLLLDSNTRDFLSEIERKLAEACLLEGNLPEAEAAANRAIEIATEQEAESDLGSAQRALGYVYQAQGNLTEARVTLDQSLNILSEHGPRYELGLTQLALATVYGSDGTQNAEAQRALELARSVFQELGAELDLKKVSALESRLRS